MNPLRRPREAIGRAWGKSSRGTTRTALWVKDGISGSVGRARSRVGGLRAGTDKRAPGKAGQADSGGPGLWERIGSAALVERARADHRAAIAWAVAGIVLVAWIAWTVYVWSENGSAAGLGVLISWPAVFVAAALVAAPLIGAGMLVHRHRLAADASPAIEGAGTTAEAATPEEEGDEASDDDESPDSENSGDQDSGDEESDEKSEAAA